MSALETPEFWAVWHPTHGFEPPADHFYDGPVVFAGIDEACRVAKSFNKDSRTNNRNGWRATKVKLERVLG